MLKTAVQEQLLPGDTLQAKWDVAQAAGYDAIELRAKGDFHFASRLDELQQARKDGVVMPTVCVDMLHFLGAFDEDLRRDAVAQMKSQLTVIAEIGGLGAQTPASYGMFSRRLPPSSPRAPRRRTARSCWPALPNSASTRARRASRSSWSRSTGTRTTWSTGWNRPPT
ncbi:hypothetical protein SANT12839_019210 [Streptomyces antimycoticus]|uniref:Xylose isomerase-like TIM barrel domain-containing protein n=1 Tax=Streptomyces antimycoticus TaxID=68175 RepID=A0A4D4K3Z1_9ACTN|nr:hypothetical protein SANT12839_019210 [Streptomyces antimycoticus]